MSALEAGENFCLEGRELAFTHEGAGSAAFSGVNFSLSGGQIMGLGGVNGSGKSSLLAVIAGLYGQSDGEFLHTRGAGAPTPAGRDMRRAISFLLMQDANMQIFGATVGEDLLLSKPDARPEEVEEAKNLAARLGLAQAWDSPPDRLSYGQKRKLCLAAALFERPEIVLFDEPFSGLDYPAACELLEILRELKAEGLACIISTHDFTDVLPLLDSVLLLPKEPGGAPFFGPPLEAAARFAAFGLKPPANSR